MRVDKQRFDLVAYAAQFPKVIKYLEFSIDFKDLEKKAKKEKVSLWNSAKKKSLKHKMKLKIEKFNKGEMKQLYRLLIVWIKIHCLRRSL